MKHFRQLKSYTPVLLFISGIVVHLLYLISLHSARLNPLFDDSMHRFGAGGDFFSIWLAGLKACHGQPFYDYTGMANQSGLPYAYPFRYAPIAAYSLGALLSLISATKAFSLWLLVCEMALLQNIRLTIRLAPDRETGLIAASLWLFPSCYFLELWVGQFTFLVASLSLWSFLCWRGDSSVVCGSGGQSRRTGDLLWGAAVCIKMMPLLFAPIAVLRGRWKAVVGSTSVLVISSFFYFLRRPLEWAMFLQENGESAPTWHAGNHGLMAFVYGAVGKDVRTYLVIHAIVVILCLAGIARLVYHAWKLKASAASTEDAKAKAELGQEFERAMLLLFAGLSAVFLLTYKDVWEHHYVLLLGPIALMSLARIPARVWLPSYLLTALPTLYALYDIALPISTDDPQRYWSHAIVLFHHGWKPLGAIWLFVGSVAWTWHKAKDPAPAGQWRRKAGQPVRRRPQFAWVALAAATAWFAGGWVTRNITSQRTANRSIQFGPGGYSPKTNMEALIRSTKVQRR